MYHFFVTYSGMLLSNRNTTINTWTIIRFEIWGFHRFKLRSFGLWCCILLFYDTNISENLATFIFRVKWMALEKGGINTELKYKRGQS